MVLKRAVLRKSAKDYLIRVILKKILPSNEWKKVRVILTKELNIRV